MVLVGVFGQLFGKEIDQFQFIKVVIRMDKLTAFVLTLVFMLSLAGCDHQPSGQEAVSTISETNSISEYLIEENGKQYLILPISKGKVKVWDEQTQYLDDIDLDLLRAAEKRISEAISPYSNHSDLYLQVDDGHLCLYAEVIIDIDPAGAESGEAGCGIDHEHKFFGERITN